MKQKLIPFRPSSHSEDYTLVGIYTSRAKAMKAYRALKRFLKKTKEYKDAGRRDWSSDEAEVHLRRRRVLFSVYTSGCLSQIKAILNAHHPMALKEHKNYQEIEIRVKLPRGITANVAPIFLPRDQASALSELKKVCLSKINRNKKNTIIVLKYAGDEIYSKEDGMLYLDGSYPVDSWKNWETYIL